MNAAAPDGRPLEDRPVEGLPPEAAGERADELADERNARSDLDNWATSGAGRLAVGRERADAVSNGWGIAGRRVTGPMQGFGRLWQRTYTLPIGSVADPQQVIAEWRAHFGDFWPKGNRFYGALEGIKPGDVAPIAVRTGPGLKLTTGVVVIYADDESFTFMTPEGHMFAGMITFSASTAPDAGGDADGTVVQVQVLIRPNDPIYDLGMPLMKFMEDRFWAATMRNLAARMGSDADHVEVVSLIVDRKRLWHNAGNVRYNAAIRSVLHLLATPFTAAGRSVGAVFLRPGRSRTPV